MTQNIPKESYKPLLPERHYAITREQFAERFIETWDMEYVNEHHLLEEFFVDPETGYDALLHIFSGEIRKDTEGKRVPFGFHHEVTSADSNTYAIRTPRLSDAAAKKLEKQDFEPYLALVRVQGEQKFTGGISINLGQKRKGKTNSMFGRAYDAFAVIKTLVDIKNNRDRSLDQAVEKPFVRVVLAASVFVADMPLLDGNATAPVKMIVSQETDEIISAVPLLYPGTPSKLGHLTLDEVHKLLLD